MIKNSSWIPNQKNNQNIWIILMINLIENFYLTINLHAFPTYHRNTIDDEMLSLLLGQCQIVSLLSI